MELITVLYSLSSVAGGIAFLPQIMALARDKSGAASISISSVFMFTSCNVISLLYATTNGDPRFIFCCAVGCVGNLAVLSLALTRRLQFNASLKHSAHLALDQY